MALRRPLAPCYLGPPKEVEAVPEGYSRVYHNRRRTAWTDYKLSTLSTPATGGDNLSLSRQSTADTDIGMDPKQQPDGSFSMSPSTLNLLAQLDAEKCLGCCMQRSKILNEALTYCRIPGYVQPCADDGWSPLLIATQRRNCDAVKTLLVHGADVDCKEPQSGWTPLMFASSLGDSHIVKILLEYGASINDFASPHDWNPLCCALQANNKNVVRLLLDAGADVSLIKRRHPALAEMYDCELGEICGTTPHGSVASVA